MRFLSVGGNNHSSLADVRRGGRRATGRAGEDGDRNVCRRLLLVRGG